MARQYYDPDQYEYYGNEDRRRRQAGSVSRSASSRGGNGYDVQRGNRPVRSSRTGTRSDHRQTNRRRLARARRRRQKMLKLILMGTLALIALVVGISWLMSLDFGDEGGHARTASEKLAAGETSGLDSLQYSTGEEENASAENGTSGEADQAAGTEQNGEQADASEEVASLAEPIPEETSPSAGALTFTDAEAMVEIPEYEDPAAAGLQGTDYVDSDYAILVDLDQGQVAAGKQARQRMIPASMTKVLTLIVAAENIDPSRLDETFLVPQEITDKAWTEGSTNVGYIAGEQTTIRDLFYGTALHSGGDAALSLATVAAGSEEAFVGLMNDKLAQLGLDQTSHFTNPVGMHSPDHYSTAYDMAVIMGCAMQNSFLREVMSAHTYTVSPSTEHPEGIEISNWFLRKIEDKDSHGTVVAAKTGYVDESGNCAVSYQESSGGGHYICVTGKAVSNWRCIYDHVAIYDQFTK